MKMIFRFFRGELNGFFINTLCTFLNLYIKTTGMLEELVYQRLFQWILPEKQTATRLPMRIEDILNLGMIGGLFQPRTASYSSLGSIWFTPSFIVNGRQRSERGLLDMEYESFMFVRVAQDNYGNDINTEAHEMRRTTYREAGAMPIGYVKEGTNLFDNNGQIIEANILPAPPADCAYVEWYGLKYLYYEEFMDTELPLTIDVYMLLFEAMQRIRRRGANITSLLEITELLGEGYIKNLGGIDPAVPFSELYPFGPAIEQVDWHYRCYYDLDDNVVVYNRERRFVAWQHAMSQKFKMFTFIDRATLG